MIDAEWQGLYQGEEIKEINVSAVVLFLADKIEWDHITKKRAVALIGPGIYFSDFLTEKERRSTFSNRIHGLLLLKKQIERALNSPEVRSGFLSGDFRELVRILRINFHQFTHRRMNFANKVYSTEINRNKPVFEAFKREIEISTTFLPEEYDCRFMSGLPEVFNTQLITSIHESEEGGTHSIPGMRGEEGSLEKVRLMDKESLNEIKKSVNKGSSRFSELWRKHFG